MKWKNAKEQMPPDYKKVWVKSRRFSFKKYVAYWLPKAKSWALFDTDLKIKIKVRWWSEIS